MSWKGMYLPALNVPMDLDKSGTYVQNDFNVSFDVTAPVLSAPASGGTTVADGRVFTSTNHHPPTFTSSVSDDTNGIIIIPMTRPAASTPTST